jgi:hypothetical protein
MGQKMLLIFNPIVNSIVKTSKQWVKKIAAGPEKQLLSGSWENIFKAAAAPFCTIC